MASRIVCLSASALVCAMVVAGAPTTQTLKAFNRVQVCAPFNTLIQPSSGNTYSVTIDAEQPVKDAFKANVNNNILSIESVGNFQTAQPIKVTVSLPASQLQEVDVSSPSAQVTVAGGFSANSFTAVSTGNSRLSLLGLNAPTVNVQNSGTGDMLVRGNLGQVSVSNQGTGTVYISGVQSRVDISLSGTGNVVVDAANGNVQITGSANGTGGVKYNRGQCSVQSVFGAFFGGTCQQDPNLSVPKVVSYWTCGIVAQGSFQCNNGQGGVSVSGNGVAGVAPNQGQSIQFGSGGATSTAFSSGSQSAFSSSSSQAGGGGASGQTATLSNGQGFGLSASGTPGTPGTSGSPGTPGTPGGTGTPGTPGGSTFIGGNGGYFLGNTNCAVDPTQLIVPGTASRR